MTYRLTSPAFGHGEEIPSRYTCDGQDVAPELAWEGVPDGTVTLTLIADDPDAPDPEAPTTTWVHWVLYNLDPGAGGLAEGGRDLPAGALDGLNDWHRTGYGGPCPPIGRHRYFFRLHALDTQLADLGQPTKAALLEATEGHILATAELMGTYRRA